MQQIKPPGILVRIGAKFLSGCGVVLLIGGFLMWFNQTYPSCANEKLTPLVSPDGKLQAVKFRRSCPASGLVSTNVSIFGADEKPLNQPGNTFIAQGETDLVIRWIDNSQLLIAEPAGTNVTLRVVKFCEILISDR